MYYGKKASQKRQCYDQCSAGNLGIHVNVTRTCTTYVKMVADHVYPLMDNAPCHTAKIVQEWFENMTKISKCCLGLQILMDVLDQQIQSMDTPTCRT